MKQEEIFKGMVECLAEILDINIDEITEESKIIDDLGADRYRGVAIGFTRNQFDVQRITRDIERLNTADEKGIDLCTGIQFDFIINRTDGIIAVLVAELYIYPFAAVTA